jgi:oxygen-independent coproporphyrinogen-3 oxidase
MEACFTRSMPAPYPSLYLHFPFCEAKCHYCDFYSIGREKTRSGDPERFEAALIGEIRLRADRGDFAQALETVFLGGGTPSMTPPDSMERIFGELFRHTRLAQEAEWTMEANPSSIDLDRFRSYRGLGINRVSMGVQSLKGEHLVKLGRVHDESEAIEALETVFQAGFTNVSTDLLCGVPGQTLSDLHSHLERLASFPLTHLSVYLLTLSPGHPLFRELPGESEQLDHLLLIDETLKGMGFEHYEISNFAKPGHRARHNLVYWTGGSYLGLGPSAHSFSKESARRFRNPSSLHRWADRILKEARLPVEDEESLTPEQLELERWMLALRLAEGFPIQWLDSDRKRAKAELLRGAGLLEPHPNLSDRLRATPRGFALSDALIRELA